MKKWITGIITAIVLIVLIVFGVKYFIDKNDTQTDAERFKEEYESLNGTTRESDGNTYNDVSISENNPIEYVTVSETLDLLKSDKAIIYIGANWCPWCRASIPVMFDVAENLGITKIYYLTLDDAKSNYEVENGEVKKINSGSVDYYKLLKELDPYLSEYYVSDDDGNSYDTGEKRIYMPFFITVKNGSIVDAKEVSRTLEDGESKYSELTDDQYDDLYSKFNEMFSKLYSTGVCNKDEKCN